MPRHFTNSSRPRGFALVITLSLMILLTVVAVGLLSLSAIAMRAARQDTAQAEARANARLALMLAIGELQQQMGPDQRVSASGAILAESAVRHPHWTGVWDSWPAGRSEAMKTSPDEPSEHRTIKGASNSGMHPTYVAQRKDHFRSWLVSLDPAEAQDIAAARGLALDGSTMPAKDAEGVELVGEGSLGPAGKQDHVTVRLIGVQSGSTQSSQRPRGGRYGWWVGDESQKARIMEDTYESGAKLSLAERVFRHQAPGSTGTTTVKGLEQFKDEKQLKDLPSLGTLDLPAGATKEASRNYHAITPFSCQVLADVREGGLKRDLTTLLERPISLTETGDEFMLYRFDTDGQERVPIQDLAAYYQLYDSTRSGWKEGVKYSSNQLSSGIQINSPDFGTKNDSLYLSEYTTLYRSPVPIKVQFLLSLFAEPISPVPTDATADTHQLRIGITPSVTLWNPTNLPLIMRFDQNPDLYAQLLRMGQLPINFSWNKNDGQLITPKKNMFNAWVAPGQNMKPHLFNFYFSGTRPIRFQPGEVKVFSFPFKGDVSGNKSGYTGNWAWLNSNFFFKTDQFFEGHEAVAGWEPRGFMLYQGSDLTFKASDTIKFVVTPDNGGMDADGSAMSFFMSQTNYQDYRTAAWERRNYQFGCRNGSGPAQLGFNQSLITKGFPQGGNIITSTSRSCANIITRANNQEGWPFLQFSLMAGTETSEAANGGNAGGRKFASRPFLHSSPIAEPFIDGDDYNSFYNYGWNWWLDEINEVYEAPVLTNPTNPEEGYYGGGYGIESGTSHVVQQEIPVVPPLAIASLSHAHLGGFTLANSSIGFDSSTWQNITATGQGGLFPHTLQAIGNSYAHPHIPADQASTVWTRVYKTDADTKQKTLADHSYLANKALWDEFYFSSISPAPTGVQVFGGTAGRSAEQVAKDFFFPATTAASTPLPNRRMVPFSENLDPTKLAGLFRKAQVFNDGLADRIAAHLMVEGPFNVNSTSVEAWKVFLSSLKGKHVAYLNKDTALTSGLKLDEDTPAGTPVGMASLPNGKSGKGSSTDASDADQWTNWRELSDDEIEQLATAMVKQVKLRGPFLSLAEFVNRRLDASNKTLSVKGALQAALDDEACTINAGFRHAFRRFSAAETSSMSPAFPDALAGPVAYGSSAYVDQADILRNFAGQLTPRGDTFVIRTYGDALDADGKVEARAWCEAVVQRIPAYLDPSDEPHVKSVDLTSDTNLSFGRKLRIVSFRFLSRSEI